MALVQPVYFLVLGALFSAAWISETVEDVKIAGGHNISISDAPYMAAIFSTVKPGNLQFKCSGTIVHRQFILTAAQCVHGGNSWRILLGTDNLDKGGYLRDVKEALCYTGYKFPATENDICLLKLFEPLGINVTTVLWPLNLLNQNSYIMNVTGWGYTQIQPPIQSNLLQTTVSVLSNELCHLFYPNMSANQLCAGNSGHGPCANDGGAPLTFNGMLIGVTCRPKCGRLPSIYTKVTSYVSWMATTIQNNLITTDFATSE